MARGALPLFPGLDVRPDERYLFAVERRIDLDGGEVPDAELVAELTDLVAQHPLRESLWERLVRILARPGRRAEALARYARLRSLLAEELLERGQGGATRIVVIERTVGGRKDLARRPLVASATGEVPRRPTLCRPAWAFRGHAGHPIGRAVRLPASGGRRHRRAFLHSGATVRGAAVEQRSAAQRSRLAETSAKA